LRNREPYPLLGSLFLCAAALLWSTAVASHSASVYQRSVIDFGAKGDGAADDRPAIQATINVVAAHGGGVVYFPAGTYKITIVTPTAEQSPWPRALTIKSNITLQGVKNTSTLIKLADNQAPYGALMMPASYGTDVSGFAMSDLTLDCNGLNNPLYSAKDVAQTNWNLQRPRIAVFIAAGSGLNIARCRFNNFIGVWCLDLYSYGVSNVTIQDNVFDKVGGGTFDFDSSTVDTAGKNCRIIHNAFYSRNAATSGGPLTYGLRAAIEVHNVDALVAKNRIYGFPIGINLGGNSQAGNRLLVASENIIQDAYNGIILYSEKPDDGSSVGMQNCLIRDNTITLNVDGWQAYGGKGGHCHGISIAQLGNADAENWDLEVTNNHIKYTNYQGTRDALDDAYSAGIYYDRYNFQSNTIGAGSSRLRFLQNTIDHPLGNGLYFRAAVKKVEISANTIIDPAAGPASFWDGWKAGLFFAGKASDLDVSNNRFVDDRDSPKMPYGIFRE
jgi:hypothetical protein